MDGQQNNSQEQYFATPDGISEIPDDHDTDMNTGSVGSQDVSFSLSTYAPLDSGSHIQSQQHFLHSQNSNSSLASNLQQYGYNPVPARGSTSFQPSPDWQHSGHHMLFGDSASVAAHNQASLDAYGYDQYTEARQRDRVEDLTMRPGQGYVAPMDTRLQIGYAYNWGAQEAGGMEYDSAPFHSPAGPSSTPVSPMGTGPGTGTGTGTGSGTGTGTGTGTETPNSFASSSSGGQYSTMYTGTTNIHAPVASVASNSTFAGDEERDSTPVPKRARTKHNPPRSNRTSSQGGSASTTSSSAVAGSSSAVTGSSSGSSVSGGGGINASRGPEAPAHPAQRPVDKKEEKKPRSSHNLVEKQYRNRLNAQFEGLMSALPESLRFQGSSGTGDSGEATTSDSMERKPSKAEVLEMARMHIQSLEQEKDGLVRERDELLTNIQRLQEIYENRATESDRIDGGWSDEEGRRFDDSNEQ